MSDIVSQSPAFNTNYVEYEVELEQFLSLDMTFNDRLPEEMRDNAAKQYTLQFSELSVMHLKDYKLCAVVSFAVHT